MVQGVSEPLADGSEPGEENFGSEKPKAAARNPVIKPGSEKTAYPQRSPASFPITPKNSAIR
jgi:hypothetical protein